MTAGIWQFHTYLNFTKTPDKVVKSFMCIGSKYKAIRWVIDIVFDVFNVFGR